MKCAQAGILQAVPKQARYVFFSLAKPAALQTALGRLVKLADGEHVLVMLGASTVAALEAQVPGLRDMPDLSGPAAQVPNTPAAMCCWLRGDDQGQLVWLTHQLAQALAPALQVTQVLDAFRYGRGPNGFGRDLTGYEDGTENPKEEAAGTAALVQSGDGLAGGSMVVVQQWVHDLSAFEHLGQSGQDMAIGRRRSDNEEIKDAPASAHVKRTEQESFDPPAFVLRRSMPWAQGPQVGLVFVAFGHSFDAFEKQMQRMTGQADGIADAMFTFSKPLSSAYFWCPPVRQAAQGARLDLRQLGL